MENFLVFIEENIARLAAEEEKLVASHRKDEANLLRIQSNVYGIGKSLYEVGVKQMPGNPKEFVLKRIYGLKNTWEASYEKAKQHNDAEKIVVEETKLHTLNDILQWILAAE